MKMQDLFGLGVRLFGIWVLCRGVTYLGSFIDIKLYPSSEKMRDGASAYLIYTTIDFTLAAVFLLWTRPIVAWSYGEADGKSPVVPSTSDPETLVSDGPA